MFVILVRMIRGEGRKRAAVQSQQGTAGTGSVPNVQLVNGSARRGPSHTQGQRLLRDSQAHSEGG